MIKTKKTAARVADILGAVESILAVDGRPRKLPGKPRAVAVTMYGKQLAKVTMRSIWDVDKVSLLGAFQLARLNAGASKEQMIEGMRQYVFAYWNYYPTLDSNTKTAERVILEYIEDIDNETRDTRELARTAKAARRNVEKAWPAVLTYQSKDVLAAA